MAVTYAGFILERPEFVSVAAARIDQAIADATARVDEEVWGDQASIGISLLAAHLISISPNGQPARLVAKDGTTTYYRQYVEMRDLVGAAWRLMP